MTDRRSELRAQVVTAQAELDKEIARVKAECIHPFAEIELTNGAVEAYCAGSVDRQLYCRCKLCGMEWKRYVRWWND